MAVPKGTIFQLPLSLLSAAQDSSDQSPATNNSAPLLEQSLEALKLQEELNDPSATARQEGGSTCLTCGIGAAAPGFASAEEQRAHFKTDWHRYNVKRRLAGLGAVAEQHFAALIENEDDQDAVGSLSGSDSDDSESEGETAGAPAGPQFSFAGEGGASLAVWRCLVAPERERGVAPPRQAECLAELQRVRQHGGRWAIILYRGGHFAAAVYNVTPPKPGTKAAAAAADSLLREVEHKSFHRYVVRAGQGGKQSTQDGTGKFARSAGSRLRRHNEAALQHDVAETMGAWKPLLAGCSLVLLAAPGSNGRSLFAGDPPMLNRADTRIRRVPFTTRRPTLSETRRVAKILVTVYELPPAAEDEGSAQPSAVLEEEVESRAGAAASAAVAAAEQAAAAAAEEEEARQRRAEKKAKQKAKQREQRREEAAAAREEAEAGPKTSPDDEISRAAALVAALASRPKPSLTGGASAGVSGGKASTPAPVSLSAKPKANEDAATRRARTVAAAEARANALQQAAQQQQLW